jgi:protein-S-isoprenylcysteine O-methyltransferase Ste14
MMTGATDHTAAAAAARASSARRARPGSRGPLLLLYAAAAYAASLLVTAYAAGFLAGFAVPKGIDDGTRHPWPAAAAADLALLLLFAAQHTVMARRWFKRAWARVAPEAAERSTYVLSASLALALLLWLWQPLPGTVWRLSGPAAAAVTAVYAAGWALALGATFMISHFDLFGLRQAYLRARGAPYRPPAFSTRGLYRMVRHPLMTGFLVVFWAAPAMSAGHLLFAAAATGYILAGTAFEERDLLRDLGEPYRAYRARVPALVPWPKRLARRGRRGAGPAGHGRRAVG